MTHMKKLILILLIIVSPIVHSEEVKLSCQITDKQEYSNVEKPVISNYVDVVSIEDDGFTKYITMTKTNISIITLKTNKDVITDTSDSTKWDISITTNLPNRTIMKSIRIDRNIGKIWYTFDVVYKTGLFSMEKGEGNCKKVDVTKKKF